MQFQIKTLQLFYLILLDNLALTAVNCVTIASPRWGMLIPQPEEYLQ